MICNGCTETHNVWITASARANAGKTYCLQCAGQKHGKVCHGSTNKLENGLQGDPYSTNALHPSWVHFIKTRVLDYVNTRPRGDAALNGTTIGVARIYYRDIFLSTWAQQQVLQSQEDMILRVNGITSVAFVADPETGTEPHILLGGTERGRPHCDSLSPKVHSFLTYLDTMPRTMFFDIPCDFNEINSAAPGLKKNVPDNLEAGGQPIETEKAKLRSTHPLVALSHTLASQTIGAWNSRSTPKPQRYAAPGECTIFRADKPHMRPQQKDGLRMIFFASHLARTTETTERWNILSSEIRRGALADGARWTSETPFDFEMNPQAPEKTLHEQAKQRLLEYALKLPK